MFITLLFRITDKASLDNSINNLLDALLAKSIDVGQKIITAVIVYIVGRWLITLLKKIGARILSKRKMDETVLSFMHSLFGTLLNAILAIIIIGVLGLPATSLAAILAAAGLAIGMAMKDNLSNFAGGVMILINRPFRIGNRILAQGQDGVVKEIGILYTILLTSDARMIYLPNGPLSTGTIINYSQSKNRRIDISFNVNAGNDIDDLKEVINNVIVAENRIQDTPAPFVGVTLVNNNSFDITLRVWVITANYADVNVSLNEAIYKVLKSKGVFINPVVSIKMTE